MLEAFGQLASDLPKSNSVARVLLLTNDKLLQIAARQRFEDRSNVSVVGGLDELRTALNAVASEITQDVIKAVVPLAQRLFFEAESKQGLYFKAEVFPKILAQFPSVIQKGPKEDAVGVVKKILVATPTFLSKSNQRLLFSTKITLQVEANEYVLRASPGPIGLSPNAGTISPAGTTLGLSTGSLGASLAGLSPGSLGASVGWFLTRPRKPDDIGRELFNKYLFRYSHI